MSLIVELQRRKVLKVGAAYLVVAWLAVQAASIAFPTFDAPAWALRVFILVSLLGFPVVLLLTWVIDLTPEGLKVDPSTSGSRQVFAAVVVLMALALGWYFYGQPSFRKGEATTPVAADQNSIAVLPFANMSSKPDEDYFSDGMTEELLNVLAKVPQLKVVARTSVFQFKDKGGDVREIGRKLGVSHIVEGSIRRDGENVRVTAQLVRVSDGFHVWSETYDRKLEGVFALQDEIAGKIAGQLVSSLVAIKPAKARGDIDPVAFDEFLKGRALHRARRDSITAISHFRNAVARATNYAAAWASMSLSYEVSYYQLDDIERLALGDRLSHMREAAARAGALAPEAAPTLHALANVARGEGRFLDAEKLYERSMVADPGYADVREDYAEFLHSMGRYEDALRAARELVSLEKAVPVFWWRIADIGISLDRKDLVDEAYLQMLHWNPTFGIGASSPFYLKFHNNRVAAAGKVIEQLHSTRPGETAGEWVMFHWAQGDRAMDDAVVRHAIAGNYGSALFAALRGDADLYFASLAAPDAPDKRFYRYSIMRAPVARRFLADPRAKQMLREAGFEQYWRVKGWPALCRPKGATDFECGDFASKAP